MAPINSIVLVVAKTPNDTLNAGLLCMSYDNNINAGRHRAGYNDKYADIASARMPGSNSPLTALAMAVRIAVFVKTNVDLERHVATVNGFNRNAAPTAHAGRELSLRLDV